MKHKWVTLVTMQLEIYHENYQYFYPSEPFEKNHITMRHPVYNVAFHSNDSALAIAIAYIIEKPPEKIPIGLLQIVPE